MNSTTRTILATAAAAAVLGLSAPIAAADGPDARLRHHDSVSPSGSPDWGLRGSKATGHKAPDQDSSTVVREVRVDDDALEYLQIGLGAVSGMTVAGATALGMRRLGRQAPTPA